MQKQLAQVVMFIKRYTLYDTEFSAKCQTVFGKHKMIGEISEFQLLNKGEPQRVYRGALRSMDGYQRGLILLVRGIQRNSQVFFLNENDIPINPRMSLFIYITSAEC